MELTAEQINEQKAWRSMGLKDNEYDMIVDQLGRDPNWTELCMFSALWSEHCAYKHSRALFHLFPTEGPHILEGPGENAGIVDVGDGLAVVFKIESHNSPSAIDPYQGAATGVGGILRDIFAMGARPVAVLNSLRFGPLTEARNRELFAGVVSGIAGYGNQVNVPTVGGEIYFDPTYSGKPLVNAMAIGLVEHDKIARASASGAGNPVMVVGAKTGRDGIHGASFSSAEVSDSGEATIAMQIGDPETGGRLIEACLELIQSGVVIGIQDMGAAGLTSSSAEMADRAGSGIEIDVLKVPRREDGMAPFEVLLSESQERMLVVPKQGAEQQVQAIFRKWGLDAVVVGRVTDDGMLRITEGDTVVAEVPAQALSTHGAPVYHPEKKEADELAALRQVPMPDIPGDLASTLLDLLASPTIASKQWAYEQFDATAQGRTLLGPGGGDAAVIRLGHSEKGVAMAVACNSRYVYLNPYRGTQIAVAEAARNIACVGGRPLAITDGMNFGSPEKPEVFWQFDQAVRGIREACLALETPVTGGNVSFYNESAGRAIYPTPIIGMIGLIDNVTASVTSGWQSEGDLIVLLGETLNELGGSEYLALRGTVGGDAPALDLERERSVQQLCRELIAADVVKSAHDCSEGGLAVTLAESSIQANLGATVAVQADFRADALLFGESQSRIVVSVAPEFLPNLEKQAKEAGVPFTVLGTVGGDALAIDLAGTPGAPEDTITIPVSDLARSWQHAIADLMADSTPAPVSKGGS